MTDTEHRQFNGWKHAIQRRVRRVARGESAERIIGLSPSEAIKWVRSHPALFLRLVELEHAEGGNA